MWNKKKLNIKTFNFCLLKLKLKFNFHYRTLNMNTDANIDTGLIEEQAIEKGDSPIGNNKTKIILITLFIILIIVICIICVLVIRNMRKVGASEEKNSSIKEYDKPIKGKSNIPIKKEEDKPVLGKGSGQVTPIPPKLNPDFPVVPSDPKILQLKIVEESKILNEILNGLKAVNDKFTAYPTRNIISTKLNLILFLNNNIKNYSALLKNNINIIHIIPTKNYKISLEFNKGISACIHSSQIQDSNSFINNMRSIFPVDPNTIKKLSITLVGQIKLTPYFELIKIFEIMKGKYLDKKEDLIILLFQYYLSLSEKKYKKIERKLITEIKELKYLVNIEENLTFGKVKQQFSQSWVEFIDKKDCDFKDIAQFTYLLVKVNDMFKKKRDSLKNHPILVEAYLTGAKNNNFNDPNVVDITDLNNTSPLLEFLIPMNELVYSFLNNNDDLTEEINTFRIKCIPTASKTNKNILKDVLIPILKKKYFKSCSDQNKIELDKLIGELKANIQEK